MRLIMKGIKGVSDILDIICRKLCLIIGVVLVADLFLGVFTRFVLGNQLSFTEELARFCMLWFAFIGGSVEVKKNKLITFTFLINRLKPTPKRILEIVDICLVILFLAVFLYFGSDAMKIFGFGKAPVTKINLAWTAMGMYVGTGVMLIHMVYILLTKVTGYVPETGKE